MATTDQNAKLQEAPKAAEAGSAPAKRGIRKGWVPVCIIGCLLSIAAWVMLPVSHKWSVIPAIGGLALSLASAIGLRRSLWRDIAVTCTIACAVLLLVFALLNWVIFPAIENI